LAEFLPGYEAIGWMGVGAPPNTSAEIIDRLNKEINAGLDDPKIQTRIVELGNTVFQSSPAEFGKLVASDTEKWAKVIASAHIKAE
jgi:tripartite-type tricarboxylate transporter receptor subunit TctC